MRPKAWRYFPFKISSGIENMAIDECLLDQVIGGNSLNTLRFYKWQPSTASIGYHQSLSAEINLEKSKDNHVDIVRRISGGGTVFHDSEGEITYAIICRLTDLPTTWDSPRQYDDSIPLRYQCILEALAQGLENIGYPINVGRIHCPALLTQNKKFSGNAQIIRKGVLLQHGTILLKVKPELMYQIIKAPLGVDYTRMVKSVRAKVIGLWDENLTTEKNKSEPMIISAIKESFEKIFKIEFKPIDASKEEITKINQFKEEKYKTWTWTNKFH